jgi:hypothetical protein
LDPSPQPDARTGVRGEFRDSLAVDPFAGEDPAAELRRQPGGLGRHVHRDIKPENMPQRGAWWRRGGISASSGQSIAGSCSISRFRRSEADVREMNRRLRPCFGLTAAQAAVVLR